MKSILWQVGTQVPNDVVETMVRVLEQMISKSFDTIIFFSKNVIT